MWWLKSGLNLVHKPRFLTKRTKRDALETGANAVYLLQYCRKLKNFKWRVPVQAHSTVLHPSFTKRLVMSGCIMVLGKPAWEKMTQNSCCRSSPVHSRHQQTFFCRMYIISTNTNYTHCGLFNNRVPESEDTQRICRYLNQGSQKSCKTLCALLGILFFVFFCTYY